MDKTLINYPMIRESYIKSGYKFYDKGTFNVNLFGIRSSDLEVDIWNDILGVAYRDELGKPQTLIHWGTTKPGLYWLKQKVGNINGTFILLPGQYPKCWSIGSHAGKYSALVQKGQPFRGWRDSDKDGAFDYAGPIYTDVTGLNMHTESLITDVQKVGAYSAGCQVRAKDTEHFAVMALLQMSAARYGNRFSYTLFNEDEFYF